MFLFRSSFVRWAYVVILIVFVAAPFIAFAQTIPTIVPCEGTNCTFCHIAQLAQNVINAGIYIAIFLSAILFAYAGWQHITAGGDPGKAGEARKIFWNVGAGLVLILVAWLIVDLIMKMLTNEAALFGPWNEIC